MTRDTRLVPAKLKLARFMLARLKSAAAAAAALSLAVLAAPTFAQEAPAASEPAATPATEPATPAAPDATTPEPATPAAPDATTPAPEATTPAPVAPAAATDVKKSVEEYWHYGKVGRYDLASAAGAKIVGSGADPAEVLKAFETTASDRKDNLDQWLLRFQSIDPMKDVTGQIVDLLNKGRYTRRGDPEVIKQNIERLATNERAYLNGIRALRDSGELSVPFLIDYLRDPTKTAMHASIRRALHDLGSYALNPLVAATEMTDGGTLAAVATSLGDIGYDVAVPYLARIAASKDAPPPARNAAADAIRRITGNSSPVNVAESFYQLADKFYYDTAAITYDKRNTTGFMWYWTQDKGLIKIDVPKEIFNELMAMRASEYALKLGGSHGDAMSLWLASNYKREVELPQGATDPTRAENQPNAHYYGVSAGAQYLNAALTRALKDHNSPVSLKVITSLQEIAGQSNALPGGHGPLVDAMAYPDRVVRFEAAFAVAASLPQQQFEGQNRVVPLLGEALAQTGQQGVLIVMPNQEQLNAMSDGLKGQGYIVTGGTTAEAAATAGEALVSVDVVLISDDLPAPDIERLLGARNQPTKLAGAAKLIMVKTGASPWEGRTSSDPMLSTTQLSDPAALKPALDQARTKAGALPVDQNIATQYATRAGNLLAKLAMSRGQVLEIGAAQPELLAALNDQRPDIVKLAGSVLGLVNSKEAQTGLLTVAADDKTADDVKISLYKSLATNAKFFGNQLDAGQVGTLSKVVDAAQNLEVRSAAAEAHGALNLPADQAKGLIVKQSKV